MTYTIEQVLHRAYEIAVTKGDTYDLIQIADLMAKYQIPSIYDGSAKMG